MVMLGIVGKELERWQPQVIGHLVDKLAHIAQAVIEHIDDASARECAMMALGLEQHLLEGLFAGDDKDVSIDMNAQFLGFLNEVHDGESVMGNGAHAAGSFDGATPTGLSHGNNGVVDRPHGALHRPFVLARILEDRQVDADDGLARHTCNFGLFVKLQQVERLARDEERVRKDSELAGLSDAAEIAANHDGGRRGGNRIEGGLGLGHFKAPGLNTPRASGKFVVLDTESTGAFFHRKNNKLIVPSDRLVLRRG